MTESSLAPGDRVGPYEVLSLLGEGGMGRVYRAKDLRLSREVALKMVRSDLPADKDRVGRFQDEARAASLLNHPNITVVHDIGDRAGVPYIVSELLQGETLRDRLATGALPAHKAQDYGVQILRGLAAAHDKGIVHRDLKPENLFLTKAGVVKILDFGIAKLGRHGEERADADLETRSQTSPGSIVGTVGYMSPEQVRGLDVDPRSDLFSFGAVFYEMLVGRRAFKGTTAADTLSAILREDPTEASGTRPVLPAGFLRIIRRALEKSPDDRFQNARDLAFALEDASTDRSPDDAGWFSGRWGHAAGRTLLGVALALALGGLGAFLGRRTAPAPMPLSYQRLTFRTGLVTSARFASDATTIVYSARWGNNPIEIFSTRPNARGEVPLGFKDAHILSISIKNRVALLLRPKPTTFASFEGMLADASLGGEAPREVLEGVRDADWSPDGETLAVVHIVGVRDRLEYPIGHVLYSPEPPAWISTLRVSPSGDQVAFLEHTGTRDRTGGVSVVDRAGGRRTLASGIPTLFGVGWLHEGREVWFGTGPNGEGVKQVRAMTLAGRERLIEDLPGMFEVHDVSRTGQFLGTRVTTWSEIRARARGATGETDLPAADLSNLSDLSDDGSQILGTDTGEGGGVNFRFYVQKTDGSPPVWLGEGDGQALSPDGKFALALLKRAQPQRLNVVPTGPGETRSLEAGGVVEYARAVWHVSGRRVVFTGIDKDHAMRLYVQDAANGPPRAFTADGVALGELGRPVAPDGLRVVAIGPDGVPALYPLDGGSPVAIPGLGDGDLPICWTPDGRELTVLRYDLDNATTMPRIERVDVATGRQRPRSPLPGTVPGGLLGLARILVTPEGESYAYNFTRSLSDLYLGSVLQ